jgi:hypothetical protein
VISGDSLAALTAMTPTSDVIKENIKGIMNGK